jgi:hypothetical protein
LFSLLPRPLQASEPPPLVKKCNGLQNIENCTVRWVITKELSNCCYIHFLRIVENLDQH